MTRHFASALLLFVLAAAAHADEMRPAYLELRETAKETYEVIWKIPARGPEERLALHVRFSGDIETIVPVTLTFTGNAFIERSTIRRAGGLPGAGISIEGLSRTVTDALVRIESIDGNSQVARLTPFAPSMIVTAAPTSLQVAKTYTILGIQHILEGIDHLLFVLCLMIVAGINRKLLITITGFTIAHSITLALSTLGLLTVPIPPVEAVIALSIVFLAVEIARGNKQGLTYRYPVAVSMSFGLLHGFGFAAVLGEIGLPQGEIPTALLFFNIGVELGQLLFIAGVIVAATVAAKLGKRVSKNSLPPFRWQPVAAYAIGAVAACWTIERIAGF